ncbi:MULTISPECIES: anthranilate synthase component 1 [Gammaproteobacteria]|uniref:anthranilate synthase component 1 n=1 Tax=Gammaproteobacteria TaxID=1236 RepID=UPI000DCFA3AB|nr:MULTISPECIES: anthranilate synthase component 1 [Gammaproteobacteria]RTE87568.1 anthranilate synthase component 1 [Aliidiomarina sp. B3213]TCZ92648.1 anthranilate synthase component 1 [Lysobacter sp. N42]
MDQFETLTAIKPGQVVPLHLTTPYQQEPLNAFLSLREENGEHILLESAEIDSRNHLKSLILIDASLRINCTHQSVNVTALTKNGKQLLTWLKSEFEELSTLQESTLTIQFQTPPVGVSESERLLYPSSIDVLRTLQLKLKSLSDEPLMPFLAGVFAYDYLASFEQLPDVPEGSNTCPDFQYYLAETLLVIDHQQQDATLIGTLPGGEDVKARYQTLCSRMGEILARVQMPKMDHQEKENLMGDLVHISVTPDEASFMNTVTALKENIRNGELFQVVPSREFKLNCSNALRSYAQLKQDNPSPYMFYMQADSFELFGASPESALKYTAATRQAELYPIAGTLPRGKHQDGSINLDLDARTEVALRSDQKELSEHMMLVDLARNDLARIGVPGSRYVADLLKVDRYSHVMHLVSRVVCTLKPELDAVDAYRACMNMGTLVGAPKLSAARFIREHEKQRRGSYGGAVGYLTGNGDMDTCIVIRSAFVQNGIATVQAGAGVVHDSNPESELQETVQKAQAVLSAISTTESKLSQTRGTR